MDKMITAAEANRKFSQVLREVGEGSSYVVTSHGRPVARIAPVHSSQAAQARARKVLLQRLRREPVTKIGRWKREELYE